MLKRLWTHDRPHPGARSRPGLTLDGAIESCQIASTPRSPLTRSPEVLLW
jgi:hypothetical protein